MSRHGVSGLLGGPGRRWAVIIAVSLLLSLACLIALALAYDRLDNRAQGLEQGATTRDAAIEALRQQVIEQGEVPVVPPPTSGVNPIDTLNEQEVEKIARQVVQSYNLPSRDVVDALIQAAVTRVEVKPGPPPSESTVINATKPIVAAYLTANPPEPGPTGPTGPAGPTGATGTGEKGDKGDQGDQGAPGVGIATATFDKSNCSIVQTLTDGSTQTFGPLCGEDGVDAFPFSFRLSIPSEIPGRDDREFTCTVTAAGTPGACEQVETEPAPTTAAPTSTP